MIESDGEIEYLEEDAEIVQQCVQQSQDIAMSVKSSYPVLLVERPRPKVDRERRKRRKEDDSDYDPAEEVVIPRKKQPPPKKTKTISTPTPTHLTYQPAKKKVVEYQYVAAREQLWNRKKYNIRIPDYDDPLCLPVRAIKVNASDQKRLTNWNNVCLEHFKYCDELLKPERGDTKKSVRTAVFKNVVNKLTGSVETTIWSKTSVENVDGNKKSEIFQCVLPRYKEKKVLNNYILGNRKMRSAGQTSEILLCRETHQDGEALVVYKPKESLSAIYGMIDKRKKTEDESSERADDDSKAYLKELACCKLCTTCFQGSWRGVKKNKNKSLVCPICARTYVSVYNLLTHLKSHSSTDMRRYQKIISIILADMVGYHYKCRICREKFESIKALRQHTPKHQSNEIFKCEVGNHLVNMNK